MSNCTTPIPGQYDTTIYAGDHMERVFILNLEDGTPIDLTGCSLLMQVKERKEDNRVWVTLTESDGLTIGGIDNNQIALYKRMPLKCGKYYYDIQFTFPTGRVKTYIAGHLTVEGDVSRP